MLCAEGRQFLTRDPSRLPSSGWHPLISSFEAFSKRVCLVCSLSRDSSVLFSVLVHAPIIRLFEPSATGTESSLLSYRPPFFLRAGREPLKKGGSFFFSPFALISFSSSSDPSALSFCLCPRPSMRTHSFLSPPPFSPRIWVGFFPLLYRGKQLRRVLFIVRIPPPPFCLSFSSPGSRTNFFSTNTD